MPKQNKGKIKYVKILVALLAIIFTAQSCNILGGGRSQGPQVELVWWKPFDDPLVVQPLIAEFTKKFPNIRVTYTPKNIESYEDELLDALASSSGPDIFSIHNDWLPKHKSKLVPSPANILSLREFQESFVQVANSDLVSDNEVYAVPLSVDVLALYYNRDILASAGIPRPPATWDELVASTRKITRQDNLGNFQRSAVAMGTADNINRAPDILGLLMLQNGTTFYSPDYRVSTLDQILQDEQGLPFGPAATALEFYTQFANPAKVSYTWNNRSNNSIEAFTAGQVAMIFSYSYLRSTLADRASFLNYAVAPVPQIDPAGTRINFANYWAEAVSKQSANQEAAWQFLKFISSKEVLPKYYEVQKQPSSRIDIVEQQLTDEEIGVFAEQVLSAKSIYKPDSDAVESIFVQMINDVILRNITPQEAASAAAQKINLLLRNF